LRHQADRRSSSLQQKQIGLLSFWSIRRDRPGTDFDERSTVNTASYPFADIFEMVQ
jgi:hypothetical protein